MKNHTFFLFGIAIDMLTMGCEFGNGIKNCTKEELADWKTFQELSLPHRLEIADRNEPGERLSLCLTVLDSEEGKPLPNRRIHFYHTSSDGEYNK